MFKIHIMRNARFHYESKMEHSLFLFFIFLRLKSKQALSESKKINKTNEMLFDVPFNARTGNKPLKLYEARRIVIFKSITTQCTFSYHKRSPIVFQSSH